MNLERKFFETKVALDETGFVSGIAWPFGDEPDRYGDTIEPGAFKSIIGKTLPILFSHSGQDTVGIWSTIKATARGLEVSGKLLVEEVARAREVAAMVKAGAARGLSVGFLPKTSKSRAGGGRHYTAVDCFECSICSTPAHPSAKITNYKDTERAARLVSAINRAAEALRA